MNKIGEELIMSSNITKKSNILLILFIVLLSVVLIFQIILLAVKIADSKKDVSENNINNSETSQEMVINVVETSIVDLVYNMEAVDSLKVRVNSEAPYDVTFLADVGEMKSVELFTFYFNDDNGNKIGIINGKNGEPVTVSLKKNTFDSLSGMDELSISRLADTQESLIDTIISCMEFEEFIHEEETEDYNSKYVKIDTPYAHLLFSKAWEEYLVVEKIEEEPYKVKFSCNLPDKGTIELFTYIFGDSGDIVVGHINDVVVGLSIGTVEADDSWTEEERTIFYTMREEMNTILDGLAKVDGFEINYQQ